jgi:hypothetical protein
VETFYDTPEQVDELDSALPPAWDAPAPAVAAAPAVDEVPEAPVDASASLV